MLGECPAAALVRCSAAAPARSEEKARRRLFGAATPRRQLRQCSPMTLGAKAPSVWCQRKRRAVGCATRWRRGETAPRPPPCHSLRQPPCAHEQAIATAHLCIERMTGSTTVPATGPDGIVTAHFAMPGSLTASVPWCRASVPWCRASVPWCRASVPWCRSVSPLVPSVSPLVPSVSPLVPSVSPLVPERQSPGARASVPWCRASVPTKNDSVPSKHDSIPRGDRAAVGGDRDLRGGDRGSRSRGARSARGGSRSARPGIATRLEGRAGARPGIATRLEGRAGRARRVRMVASDGECARQRVSRERAKRGGKVA
jgi:hypothetical protein